MYVCTYVHTTQCSYIHTYIHTQYIHTYIHTWYSIDMYVLIWMNEWIAIRFLRVLSLSLSLSTLHTHTHTHTHTPLRPKQIKKPNKRQKAWVRHITQRQRQRKRQTRLPMISSQISIHTYICSSCLHHTFPSSSDRPETASSSSPLLFLLFCFFYHPPPPFSSFLSCFHSQIPPDLCKLWRLNL